MNNSLIRPAEVAMEINKNRYKIPKFGDELKCQNSLEQYYEKNTRDAHDKFFNMDRSTREILFPRGIKADLQKDIERNSTTSYIGNN